jgi:nucleotide-binding universal stress UspA family protein
VTAVSEPTHLLVVYGPSAGGDATLRGLADSASEGGVRLSVVKLVPQESEDRGCCDTRSVLWNEISRDLAREDLARAALAVDGRPDVELAALHFSGRSAVNAVVREAAARDADAVVLAGAPLGRLARRRLRRISPVPVR